ncbi:PaaI family thioesterase [Desulfuromonas acetoxidans]|uniref:Acyl-coenzyme A thioesterase THEM4 n=1 Tax=Desulfuromonas acetoxidans (strain DSM 684 / 11070) TaxID=281689 RepID=Q1JWH7_DESA6|nr:PaaI family thioesterase [Desulfuromonas acetoxidans]EAT14591.1 thioesterase superfamily [Desulfuromonas acetoxidans DSM 684]
MTIDLATATGQGQGHQHCIMCGEHNPLSLKLSFSDDGQGGVHTSFRGSPWLQGYQSLLHGGIICSLLDSAMTHCLFAHRIKAVTGELKIRFVQPVPAEATLQLSARITHSLPPVYRVEAQLHQENCLMARADAKFMQFDALPNGADQPAR